ncbi:DUF2264 domain-containing protein [Jiangella alkaliphila]|uniref:DUF2264 domain-containing protein n=1 Tax=Jiangella alkaliphila TaxID=419479 RepID=A0A1H2LH55_9ACTN|nr:DUF2264 domain-containing protein [Jiangella alkaliphila]SDU79736.1 hypothetical protein SAMN04488563_6056 [Jiangella alkaliphila]
MTAPAAPPSPRPPTSGPPLTRADWERTADQLLLAVRPFASARHGLVHLPGSPSISGRWSDGLEGFARTFLLAAFRLRGAGGNDPHDLAAWYAEGLTAGLDPSGPERWPEFAECNQAKVEAASVAIALHETRPWLWDRLAPSVQHRLSGWLAGMVGQPMPGNNWVWFQAVTEAFNRTVGGPWQQADLDRTVEQTEQWYAGDGWYSDGLSGGAHRNFDHYNAWAMHLYPLWFCRVLGAAAPDGLLDRYRTRLTRFLDDARHLVGANGSPLVQGRSLTYRIAALAPFWTGALFAATPLPPGQTRRVANAMLRHFLDHGAVDEHGLLTPGWHHRFPNLLQVYSGPASPYWASKGFAGLLLDPSDLVWTAPEQPLPVETADFGRTLAGPGWLVAGTRSDGVVRVVNHGSDHVDPARCATDDPAYARVAYSTHVAPEMPDDPSGGPADSCVTLLDAAGRAAHRRPLTRLLVAGHVAVSRHRAHWPEDESPDPFRGPDTTYRLGPVLTTASVLRGDVEVRLVRVDPAPTPPDVAAAGPWRVRIGGWALPDPATVYTVPGRLPRAEARGAGGLWSSIGELGGLPVAEVLRRTGSNPIGTSSAVPILTSLPLRSLPAFCAAVVRLASTGLTADIVPGAAIAWPAPAGPATVTVRWPGGATDTVQLDPPSPGEDPACTTTAATPNAGSRTSSTGISGPPSTATPSR